MVFTGRLWITFGLFLLGMCAGRLEVFRDTEPARRFFTRLLWPAGLVALSRHYGVAVPHRQTVTSIGDLLNWFSFTIQQLSLSTFYVASITLLYWRRPSRACCLRSRRQAGWA